MQAAQDFADLAILVEHVGCGTGFIEVVAAPVEDLKFRGDKDDVTESAQESGVVGLHEVVDPYGDFCAEVDDSEISVGEAIERGAPRGVGRIHVFAEGFPEEAAERVDGIGGLTRDDVGKGYEVSLQEVEDREDIPLAGGYQAEADAVEDLGGHGAFAGKQLGNEAVAGLSGGCEFVEVEPGGIHAVDDVHDAAVQAEEEVFFAVREMECQFAGFEVIDDKHDFEGEAGHACVRVVGGGIEEEVVYLVGLCDLSWQLEVQDVPDISDRTEMDFSEAGHFIRLCGVELADFQELVDGRDVAIVEFGPVDDGLTLEDGRHFADVCGLDGAGTQEVLERGAEIDQGLVHDRGEASSVVEAAVVYSLVGWRQGIIL